MVVPGGVIERDVGCGPVALSTSTSIGPSRSAISATSRATAASSVTSATNASAVPPAAQIARATSPAAAASRPLLTATASPSSASRRAIATPSPRELPVTRATRRWEGVMGRVLRGERGGALILDI